MKAEILSPLLFLFVYVLIRMIEKYSNAPEILITVLDIMYCFVAFFVMIVIIGTL